MKERKNKKGEKVKEMEKKLNVLKKLATVNEYRLQKNS